jgi:hypothetical protein
MDVHTQPNDLSLRTLLTYSSAALVGAALGEVNRSIEAAPHLGNRRRGP